MGVAEGAGARNRLASTNGVDKRDNVRRMCCAVSDEEVVVGVGTKGSGVDTISVVVRGAGVDNVSCPANDTFNGNSLSLSSISSSSCFISYP